MGTFKGYSFEKLLEKAAKRKMTVDEYCNYLEYKQKNRGKKVKS